MLIILLGIISYSIKTLYKATLLFLNLPYNQTFFASASKKSCATIKNMQKKLLSGQKLQGGKKKL
jgi:hypothetical protein